jgi:hypothetical protein
MTLAQRIELMVRMVLFCGTVAIYIWYRQVAMSVESGDQRTCIVADR